jgi:signal transduction histidine kinase
MQATTQKMRHTATGRWFWRLQFAFAKLTERKIPPELLVDPETARRARLIAHFGLLGSIFGLIYASFYVAIGHLWGAAIIAVCTLGVALTPLLMRWTKAIAPAGNLFSLVLVLGFLGLCLCEGGLNGHAIAWLVSIPLCAMLLLGIEAAIKWIVISLLCAALVAGLALGGIDLEPTYEARWQVVISTPGYLGLIAFMSILGLIFERGRLKAQARMQEALQRLAETNQKLVVMNEEKNEFLGIAAHDLKNPLTSIMVNGDLLRSAGDPRQVKYAGKIIASAETMRNLITDLLDVHAIEEGRFASKLEPCDLVALVCDGIEANLPHATHKQIELLTGELASLTVRTDRTAARQILDNLISNAVKYSPRGATVQLDLTARDGRALICVRDCGVGLSEEDQKNLFKKFSRLSAKPTGGESSNGLGLAIAHRLARALGGAIRCESKLGEGSTFIFELPLPLPDEATVVVAQIDPIESPMVTRNGAPAFAPAAAAFPEPPPDLSPPRTPAVAMPAPPRHAVPAPPGPLAKQS